MDAVTWCGTYYVYEDREAMEGRKIGLRVVVVPARSRSPKPDPLFYFAGGPGQGASESMGIVQALAGIREQRDVVFVDQRGTGSSHPLDCDGPNDESPLQAHFGQFLEIDHVRRCLEKQDADVALYTTPIAMDDINDVRAALGYDRINLVGGSYGTRAALIYLRRHPETVRAAVLKGVASQDMKNPLPFARAAERGLRATFDACAVEPECHAAFPDLERDWDAVLAQFDDGPVSAEVAHPNSERRETVTIAKGVFADGIRHMLYSVGAARNIPRVVHAAAKGDFSPFAEIEIRQALGFGDMLSMGMFLTVTCSEDVRFIKEEEIGPWTDGTYLGDYRIRQQQAACEHWELGDVSESYMDPVEVDTPVLLISGVYDTASPFELGDRAARHLPNSLHVIFPNASHGFANPACQVRLMTEFIASGTTKELDTSCVKETRRPRFVVPE